MVCKYSEVAAITAENGVTRRVLASGGGMMTVEFRFPQGAIGAVHTHPHEQVGYVVSGRFALTFDGKVTEIRAGDTYYVPSGVPHGAVALEEGVLLDVFTPQRQDFLP